MDDLDRGILFFPNGDINIKQLEIILEDHLESCVDAVVECLERVRVSDPDFEKFPRYESITLQKKVGELRRLYVSQEGCEYSPRPISHAIPVLLYSPETGRSFVVDMGS